MPHSVRLFRRLSFAGEPPEARRNLAFACWAFTHGLATLLLDGPLTRRAGTKKGGQAELADKHHAFSHDLEAKGMLVGAGPFLDDSGQRFGTGMIIFRCPTRAEAEKIANSEPYIAHGVRRLKLLPWQKLFGR